MATIYLTNAPFIRVNFIVSQIFSQSHHALDLAPYGGNQPLYAIDDFTVIGSYPDTPGQTYGNYFIAKSDTLNQMYLYAHMNTVPPAVGTHFSLHEQVGLAGRTDGDTHTSTGIHLHLEIQYGYTWNYNAPFSAYRDPTTYLIGIRNVKDDSNVYYYDGTPTPHPTSVQKKRFPFYILWNQGIY